MAVASSVLTALAVVFALVGVDQRLRAERTLRLAEHRMRQVNAHAEDVGGMLGDWASLVHEQGRATAQLAVENDALRVAAGLALPSPYTPRFTPEGYYVPIGFSLN